MLRQEVWEDADNIGLNDADCKLKIARMLRRMRHENQLQAPSGGPPYIIESGPANNIDDGLRIGLSFTLMQFLNEEQVRQCKVKRPISPCK